MDTSIDNLQLDLRGVPPDTAEAVPALLGQALSEAVENASFDRRGHVERLPELHLTLLQGETAPALARRIAQTLIRSLGSSNVDSPTQID